MYTVCITFFNIHLNADGSNRMIQMKRTNYSELFNLGLIPDQTLNCRIVASQAERCIIECVIHRKAMKACTTSARISWWKLNILWCPSQKLWVSYHRHAEQMSNLYQLRLNVKPVQPVW